jgi:hypothetical protein
MPLFWDVYLPTTDLPPNGWPVVILVKDAGFEKGRRCSQELKCIARDLTDSGFAVVSIDIRHDKVGMDQDLYLPCQVQAAYSPPNAHQQVTDLRKAILRVRNPAPTSALSGKVSDLVGAVGGSGGGALVAWCAATESTLGAGDKLDAGVCLSGAYDFDDDRSLSTQNQCNGQGCQDAAYGFCVNVTDYCKVTLTDPPHQCTDHHTLVGNLDLIAGSPIEKIDESGVNTAPLYAFATFQDYMPGPQFDLICAKIADLNGNMMGDCSGSGSGDQYKAMEFSATGTDKHSFSYWFDTVNQQGDTVNKLAKDFLCDHLDAPCPP